MWVIEEKYINFMPFLAGYLSFCRRASMHFHCWRCLLLVVFPVLYGGCFELMKNIFVIGGFLAFLGVFYLCGGWNQSHGLPVRGSSFLPLIVLGTICGSFHGRLSSSGFW